MLCMDAARKTFRWFLVVALFCTHQQGATHRGARRQEPLVSRLPTAALSCVASVDKAIPPYARAPPPPDISKNPQSPQATPCLHVPGLHGISVPHTSGRPPPHIQAAPPPIYKRAPPPHTQAAPSTPAVPTHPRGFPHMQVLFPHTFPRRPQPHTPARIPIGSAGSPHVSTAPPCNLQAPKIPTLVSMRPAFPAPQTRHPRVSANSLRRLLARYRMSRRGTNPPRPATGLLKPTHPAGFPQIPCANDGEAGVGAWRRLATRRRRRSGGLHSSPPEGRLVQRGGADPRGAGAGWTRQKSAGAASGQSDPQDG